MKSKFKIGDIVVLKSHPLLLKNTIQENFKLTSPIFFVKEIHKESKDKSLFSGDFENSQISDFTKYNCTYFDTELCSFKDILIYESLITSFKKLQFHSNHDNTSSKELIEETSNYKTSDYNYGHLVALKNHKLELRKKYGKPEVIKSAIEKTEAGKEEKSKLESKIFPLFTSPNFILIGIVNNKANNISRKKKVAKILYKVSWFNSKDKKLSNELLPKQFFVSLPEENRLINLEVE